MTGRTLADYRPQHDDDCAALACGLCGQIVHGYRERPAMAHPDADGHRHRWQFQACSCGLDALLTFTPVEAARLRMLDTSVAYFVAVARHEGDGLRQLMHAMHEADLAFIEAVREEDAS